MPPPILSYDSTLLGLTKDSDNPDDLSTDDAAREATGTVIAGSKRGVKGPLTGLDLPDSSFSSNGANLQDLIEPLHPRAPPPAKLDLGATTGDARSPKGKPVAADKADDRDDIQCGDPSEDVDSVQNVEHPSFENTDLPRPAFDAHKDRQPREILRRNHQRMRPRRLSSSRGRGSVDSNKPSAVREVTAEDKVIIHGQAHSGNVSPSSSRSNSPEGIWSNASSLRETRFSNSTTGTSPDRSVRHSSQERDYSHFRRRDSSGARPYVIERERYHPETSENISSRRYNSYSDTARGGRYQRDRRLMYSERSTSRERQNDRTQHRIQRRVTDYHEAFHDAEFGGPSQRIVHYERRRMSDRDDRFRYGLGDRYHGYYRTDRRPDTYWERPPRRDSDLDVGSSKDSESVTSPGSTERIQNVGDKLHGPDDVARLEAVVVAGEVADQRTNVENRDADHVGSSSLLGIIVPPASKDNAKEVFHGNFGNWNPDCAESSFSQAMMVSGMLSMKGIAGVPGTTGMVDRIISTILCSDSLQRVSTAALKDSGIGSKKYRKAIRRMIKTFGMDLSTEATSLDELRVAFAMQTPSVSTDVARRIMERTRATGTRQDEPINDPQPSNVNSEPRDEDKGVLTERFEDEAERHSFILNSNACDRFKATLLDFAHKTYERRILNALSVNIGLEMHQNKSAQSRLSRIARELSWVPTSQLTFSHDSSLGPVDLFKGFVEDAMSETWNWAPLQERKRRLHDGFFRLHWKTLDGRSKHIDLSVGVEAALRDAFDTAPAFVNRIIPFETNARSVSGNAAAGATHISSPTMPLPSYQAGRGTSSIPVLRPQTPVQPLSTAFSNIQPHGPGIRGVHNEQYIYLCIEAGARHFVGMDCNGVQTDVEFFNKLKSEYDSARGRFRLWFSTWRYDHCEFFKFQKTGLGLGARLEIAFPEPTDPLYHYLPKPLDKLQLPPHGPISHD